MELSLTGSEFKHGVLNWGYQLGDTSVAHPLANGQVEVTNRTIVNAIRVKLETSEGNWIDRLEILLKAYMISPRTTTGESSFRLVYGADVVIPAEVGIKAHRVAQMIN